MTIPFDFIVRGKTLPAGRYEITRIGESNEALQIYNEFNHKQIVFGTDSIEARKTPKRAELVFHKYGDDYFLYEIWSAGISNGRELPPSKTEKRIERASFRQNTTPETVALIADE